VPALTSLGLRFFRKVADGGLRLKRRRTCSRLLELSAFSKLFTMPAMFLLMSCILACVSRRLTTASSREPSWRRTYRNVPVSNTGGVRNKWEEHRLPDPEHCVLTR
jgi:hypothetical protein